VPRRAARLKSVALWPKGGRTGQTRPAALLVPGERKPPARATNPRRRRFTIRRSREAIDRSSPPPSLLSMEEGKGMGMEEEERRRRKAQSCLRRRSQRPTSPEARCHLQQASYCPYSWM
jgi:hypothetical protein